MVARVVPIYLVMAIAAILSPVRAAAQADKIYAENSKAVVVVVAAREDARSINQGSGFIVREDGAVVTNYHVINTASTIKVKAGDAGLRCGGPSLRGRRK